MKRLLLGMLLLTSSAAAQNATLVGKDGWLFYSADYIYGPVESDIDDSVTKISGVVKALETKGIKTYIIVVPNKTRVFPEKLPDGFTVPAAFANEYGSLLKRFADQNVPTIDLLPTFLASPDRYAPAPIWRKTDTHWSPSGILEASVPIGKVLEQLPAVKSLPEVQFSLKVAEPKVYNQLSGTDLYYSMSPALQAAYPDPGFTEREITVERAKPSDLLADETPGITVVGTSFGHFMDSLLGKTIAYRLSRDVLDVSVAALGSWTPMVRYIKSDTFKANPPKVILWEIPERFFYSPNGPIISAKDSDYLEIMNQLK